MVDVDQGEALSGRNVSIANKALVAHAALACGIHKLEPHVRSLGTTRVQSTDVDSGPGAPSRNLHDNRCQSVVYVAFGNSIHSSQHHAHRTR